MFKATVPWVSTAVIFVTLCLSYESALNHSHAMQSQKNELFAKLVAGGLTIIQARCTVDTSDPRFLMQCVEANESSRVPGRAL